MVDRPTEARAYGAHNTAPPLSNLPAYAGVSLGMALCTQPSVVAYGADQALSVIDMIRYLHVWMEKVISSNVACQNLFSRVCFTECCWFFLAYDKTFLSTVDVSSLFCFFSTFVW